MKIDAAKGFESIFFTCSHSNAYKILLIMRLNIRWCSTLPVWENIRHALSIKTVV